jgi:hypothetical protein
LGFFYIFKPWVGYFLHINPTFADVFYSVKTALFIIDVRCFWHKFTPFYKESFMRHHTHCILSFLIIVAVHLDTSIAQTTLNGFLNIPFGTKMETAKKLLLQKPGVKFIRQTEHNDLYFTGLSMGAYQADTCFLLNSQLQGKFESSKLVFHSKTEFFEELYELHCAKYGSPTKTYSMANDVVYKWEFPVRGSKYTNSIILQSVSSENYFMLSYSGTGTLCPGWLQHYTHKTKSNTENF